MTYPILVEPAAMALASRIGQDLIQSRRQGNDAVWLDENNWKFGFYFGRGDRRLWVPKRAFDGRPDESERVINFCHPLGKRAWRVLMIAYAVCTTAAATLIIGLVKLIVA